MTNAHLIAYTLRCAQKYLWDGVYRNGTVPDGTSPYICLAIGYVKSLREETREDTKKYVGGHLGDTPTVTGWLRRHGHIGCGELNMVEVQTYRRKWMDHMITYLEALDDES